MLHASYTGIRSKNTYPVATPNQIQIEQLDQLADQLISQLFAFKASVADLREKMAEVSTPAPGNGLLSDEEKAAILNRRARALAKKHY